MCGPSKDVYLLARAKASGGRLKIVAGLLIRSQIVSQCPLGLEIEGFAELSEIFEQGVRIHMFKMFQR